MTDRLTTVIEQIDRLPGHTPATLVAEPISVARPSRSRQDQRNDGAPAYHPQGWGIVAAPTDGPDKARDDDGRWMIRSTIRPPETDAERDAIAQAMAAKWREETRYVHALAADDVREDVARDDQRAAKTEIEARLQEVL